ncbi:unnamed protein product [Cylindrotheca closterium]|uniref:Uncharacterized protein n=1 Tax=Cylindrotheca closterium TaxID=2856 RepID=A0AAD2PTY3_9STRA|nr:unnamed protein product [Cylindrotheca closterium]
MPELKRRSTPMPGTMKAVEYHARTNRSTSSLCTRRYPRSMNRRRSNGIMNCIDHVMENGVPTPQQQLGSHEITKPYTRLSDSRGGGSPSIASTTAPLEDSLSSIESFNELEETGVLPSTDGTDKKEDQSPTIAIWAWDRGLLESRDDTIDIWDELFLSKFHSQSP